MPDAPPDHPDGSEAISRVGALEERMAHHERALDELSDMVRAQQAALVRLLDVVERLEAAAEPTLDGRPPHW